MGRAHAFLLASLVWLIGCILAFNLFDPKDERIQNLFGLSMLIGFPLLLLIGTTLSAKAKGYNSLLGFVLGWIVPFGLQILVFLPNRTVQSSAD